MNKIYCNECKKEVDHIKGICPSCGLKFNNDLIENELENNKESNAISIILKVTSAVMFIIGIFLAIFQIGNFTIMFFIILICSIIVALAELIQILHDIKNKICK